MHKRVSHAIGARSVCDQQDFIAWSLFTLWGLASVYLLTMFSPY